MVEFYPVPQPIITKKEVPIVYGGAEVENKNPSQLIAEGYEYVPVGKRIVDPKWGTSGGLSVLAKVGENQVTTTSDRVSGKATITKTTIFEAPPAPITKTEGTPLVIGNIVESGGNPAFNVAGMTAANAPKITGGLAPSKSVTMGSNSYSYSTPQFEEEKKRIENIATELQNDPLARATVFFVKPQTVYYEITGQYEQERKEFVGFTESMQGKSPAEMALIGTLESPIARPALTLLASHAIGGISSSIVEAIPQASTAEQLVSSITSFTTAHPIVGNAVIGGMVSSGFDIGIQKLTKPDVDWGEVAISGVSGAFVSAGIGLTSTHPIVGRIIMGSAIGGLESYGTIRRIQSGMRPEEALIQAGSDITSFAMAEFGFRAGYEQGLPISYQKSLYPVMGEEGLELRGWKGLAFYNKFLVGKTESGWVLGKPTIEQMGLKPGVFQWGTAYAPGSRDYAAASYFQEPNVIEAMSQGQKLSLWKSPEELSNIIQTQKDIRTLVAGLKGRQIQQDFPEITARGTYEQVTEYTKFVTSQKEFRMGYGSYWTSIELEHPTLSHDIDSMLQATEQRAGEIGLLASQKTPGAWAGEKPTQTFVKLGKFAELHYPGEETTDFINPNVEGIWGQKFKINNLIVPSERLGKINVMGLGETVQRYSASTSTFGTATTTSGDEVLGIFPESKRMKDVVRLISDTSYGSQAVEELKLIDPSKAAKLAESLGKLRNYYKGINLPSVAEDVSSGISSSQSMYGGISMFGLVFNKDTSSKATIDTSSISTVKSFKIIPQQSYSVSSFSKSSPSMIISSSISISPRVSITPSVKSFSVSPSKPSYSSSSILSPSFSVSPSVSSYSTASSIPSLSISPSASSSISSSISSSTSSYSSPSSSSSSSSRPSSPSRFLPSISLPNFESAGSSGPSPFPKFWKQLKGYRPSLFGIYSKKTVTKVPSRLTGMEIRYPLGSKPKKKSKKLNIRIGKKKIKLKWG